MKIHTSLVPSASLPEETCDCAVVIDVLRATSVITTALFHGAESVVTCDSIATARTLKTKQTLLCGERGCRPIDGFDLGNSPDDYQESLVAERQIVLTTTNGTRAIEAVGDCRDVFIASFLNLRLTARALRNRRSLALICSATENQVSNDDVLLAGALIDQWCQWDQSIDLCDASVLALGLWRASLPTGADEVGLAMRLRETLGGRNLIRVGYEDDLRFCAQVNQKPILIKRVSRLPMRFAIVQ